MTWVKICGLSRRAEIDAAESAGADAVGLVLVPESPRAVQPDTAAGLAAVASIPVFILTKDARPAELLDLASFVGASGVQPYGEHVDEAVDAAVRAGLQVLYPVGVDGEPVSLAGVRDDVVPIVDRRIGSALGGTGEAFDPDLLDDAGRNWVLAGGLTPASVADRVQREEPWGVDVSSGVESRRGVKDLEAIRRFVEETKRS